MANTLEKTPSDNFQLAESERIEEMRHRQTNGNPHSRADAACRNDTRQPRTDCRVSRIGRYETTDPFCI
jgi:hypothetical protein